MNSEYQQAMLERMQMLEEALDRAEAGVATPDDWLTIRHECGMPARQSLTETKENHGTNSESISGRKLQTSTSGAAPCALLSNYRPGYSIL
ncbi:MAG: hypothetical protein EBY78_07155 [Actinobacteria bacterium]|nr:hypothetical protein [Actinomycetota bacterium]